MWVWVSGVVGGLEGGARAVRGREWRGWRRLCRSVLYPDMFICSCVCVCVSVCVC